MFDKKKCRQCKYHAVREVGVHCNYSGVTGVTCLRRTASGGVIDTRGNNPKKCALYKKGERLKSRGELI